LVPFERVERLEITTTDHTDGTDPFMVEINGEKYGFFTVFEPDPEFAFGAQVVIVILIVILIAHFEIAWISSLFGNI